MRNRQLTGIILASALVTLDGTATTIALPAIGRDLSASVLRLQWIANAPLLVLASLLLPAGMVADRYGGCGSSKSDWWRSLPDRLPARLRALTNR
jgi:MFS family permease